MKNKFLILLGLGGLLASCSSVYKTGQTPDDLYYAESPAVTANVRSTNAVEDDYVSGDDGEYRSLWGDSDDNYLRQKVSNGGRWNTIDDNNYWNGYTYASGAMYNPYMYGNTFNSWNNHWNTGFYNYNSMWGFSPMSMRFGNPYFGMGMGFGMGFDPFWGYNSMFTFNRFGGFYGGYNNFYGGGYYGNGYWGNNGGTKPNPIYRNATRPNSLSRYSNSNGFSRMNTQSASSSNRNTGTYRSVFGNGNNGSNNNGTSYDRPARTFNTGSSNSGGSGSFGGGGSSSSSGGSSRSSGGGNSSRGGR